MRPMSHSKEYEESAMLKDSRSVNLHCQVNKDESRRKADLRVQATVLTAHRRKECITTFPEGKDFQSVEERKR